MSALVMAAGPAVHAAALNSGARKTVRLIDGTEVSSDSEAWRAECEARAVCAMPRKIDRIRFMNGEIDPTTKRVVFKGVLQQRGQDAYDKLKSDILRIWAHQKSQ